jgi:phage I-like protein
MSKKYHFALQDMPEKDIEWVQLIRKGEFNHAYYGKFDITEEVLREFKLNFDRNARRVDIAIDYFHDSHAEAAGWVKEVELKENDSELWVRVEWTDKAKEKILGKEIRYISAEFDLDYVDSETKKEYGATLYGAGITNRPHVKDMQPIFSEAIINNPINNKNKETNMVDFKEILESVGELSEDEKLQLGEKLGFTTKTAEAGAEAKKLSEAKKLADEAVKAKDADIKKLSDTVTKLSGTVKDLTAENAKKDKEAQFNTMLSNGNVVEAQRAAFMDSDIAEFAKNAVAGINLKEAGSGASSEDDEANIASAKFTEEADKLVKEEGITFTEAAKRVTSANPSLLKAS